MLGVLIDNLTPEAPAPENVEISPAKPRDLSAVFSSIGARLINSVCTPACAQQRSQSQESTDVSHPCQVQLCF